MVLMRNDFNNWIGVGFSTEPPLTLFANKKCYPRKSWSQNFMIFSESFAIWGNNATIVHLLHKFTPTFHMSK